MFVSPWPGSGERRIEAKWGSNSEAVSPASTATSASKQEEDSTAVQQIVSETNSDWTNFLTNLDAFGEDTIGRAVAEPFDIVVDNNREVFPWQSTSWSGGGQHQQRPFAEETNRNFFSTDFGNFFTPATTTREIGGNDASDYSSFIANPPVATEACFSAKAEFGWDTPTNAAAAALLPNDKWGIYEGGSSRPNSTGAAANQDSPSSLSTIENRASVSLDCVSPEIRRLLRSIPRKSREAMTPSDEAAFRTCHPQYSRNCYILMHLGYDIRLGESGRALLKKEISRRLKTDSQLRERCVSIVCRLKNANVLQLLQMAEISGCLHLGLRISSGYWKEYARKQRPGSVLRRSFAALDRNDTKVADNDGFTDGFDDSSCTDGFTSHDLPQQAPPQQVPPYGIVPADFGGGDALLPPRFPKKTNKSSWQPPPPDFMWKPSSSPPTPVALLEPFSLPWAQDQHPPQAIDCFFQTFCPKIESEDYDEGDLKR